MSKTKKKRPIRGTADRPRLAVFRSLRYVSAQVIDDDRGKTLVSAHEKELTAKVGKLSKTERAAAVGALLAEKVKKAKVKKVVFDRRRYRYHGRVKALAEAARKEGLEF